MIRVSSRPGKLVSLNSAILILLSVNITCSADDSIQYNRDVRPILAEHCFACHGLDSIGREADLRLDVREAAIDSGAIVPHDAAASEMIARVNSDDADLIMPPPASKKPLTADQRRVLEQWVAAGANYENHWALVAPAKGTPPQNPDSIWPKTPIDQFVLHRLTREGLTPAVEARPSVLFRRLHLDITGLPPLPADVEAFVSEYTADGDDALSRWIDKLMTRDTWGEHRGRYWLDAARYADTHGMHFDNYREMWPYRDWVIRSFNSNQPFDQFTIEQLAGDLLENPTLDQRIATGFQRCNMTTNEGGTIEAENLAIYASDRVQTFGWVYLGLTTNCCQCHDHKFDPLSMRDYYSLAAFFRNTTQKGFDGNEKFGKGPVIRVPSPADAKRLLDLEEEIPNATRARNERRVAARSSFSNWLNEVERGNTDASLSRDRQLFLPLNDGSDDVLTFDSTVEEIAATPTGELTWIDGRFGPAIQLTSGGIIDIEGAGDFNLKQPFSHAEWIRTSKLNQYLSPVARMNDANRHRGWDLFLANGKLAVHLVDSWPDNAIKVTTRSAVIRKDTWQHVCVTWDGTATPEGITIYVDGNLAPTEVNTKTLSPEANIRAATPLRIGRRSSGAVFDGAVQNFRLFSRKLEADDVDALIETDLLTEFLSTAPAERTEARTEELYDRYLVRHDAAYRTLAESLRALEKEREAIENRSPATHVQVERSDRPATANLLMRGQYDQVGEEVRAAPPASLHPMPEGAPANRLGLARWVVDPANPLTARVTVNRFWQEVFGRGIVATPEDFGVMGTPPSNPELLDWLAVDFVQNGWDVKRLFKQIFMSATYRQAAVVTAEKTAKDRDNDLLSRGPRFRMDAEMVRDFALTVAGLRSSTMYGPGVRPYQPENIWNMVGLPGGNTRDYKQDAGEKLYRRSLYSFWKRMAPPPGLEAFNAPNREVCTVRRERTNTPLQALVTLNAPQYIEAARNLAQRGITTAKEPSSIANNIAGHVLSRPFSEQEMKVVLKTFREYADHYKGHTAEAIKLINVGDSSRDESIPPETLAAWTIVCNQIMNLDEALNK